MRTFGHHLVAITRGVSNHIGACELTHLPRIGIDVALAREQHGRYEDALRRAGCRVVSLPPLNDYPDAVFVEDTAIVLDELAILTRPGASSRRMETATVADALRSCAGFAPVDDPGASGTSGDADAWKASRAMAQIEEPGTLDGGDVLRLGKRIFVGLSGRSNTAALDQLRQLVGPHDYTVTGVAVTGCLHLKSAVTEVAAATILVNPAWVDPGVFGDVDAIAVDPDEPYAANGLLIAGLRQRTQGHPSQVEGYVSRDRVEENPAKPTLIYPSSFPRTRRVLEARGIHIDTVDVSELQKAEGAVTCCSLVFMV